MELRKLQELALLPKTPIPEETIPRETIPRETIPKETIPDKAAEDRRFEEVVTLLMDEVGPQSVSHRMGALLVESLGAPEGPQQGPLGKGILCSRLHVSFCCRGAPLGGPRRD